MRNMWLGIALFVFGVAAAGCGPGYAVYQQSGGLAGANPIGLAFDYSGAIHQGRMAEQEWLSRRSPEELAEYQMIQQQFQTTFAQHLADQTGRTIVPATGQEPAVLTVRLERFILGRYVPFAATATQVFGRMSFSRQGQVTDEIGTECVRAASVGTSKERRITYCGQILGTLTSRFVNTQ